MTDRKTVTNFTVLTFCIAYLVSGVLIILGQFGYQVYNWVDTLPQFCANIPFAIYILSPAIASYIILRRNNKVAGLREWLKTVFYAKNNIYPYVFVVAGLVLYFSLHTLFSGNTGAALPLYAFFLSLPGNLFIGGLEEAGWAYIMQPGLARKLGYIPSCILSGGHLASVAYPAFLHTRDKPCRRRDPFLDVCRSVYGAAFFLWRDLQNIRKKPCVHVCVISHHVQCRFLCLCLCDNNLAGNDRRKFCNCAGFHPHRCGIEQKANQSYMNII